MSNMFEIGDMVTICSKEFLENKFGVDHEGNILVKALMPKQMYQFCGKKFEISKVLTPSCYKLAYVHEEDKEDEQKNYANIHSFIFSMDMFEEAYQRNLIHIRHHAKELDEEDLTDEDKKQIEKNFQSLVQAMKDYNAHCTENDMKTIIDMFSQSVMRQIVVDNYLNKCEIREMFRKHPKWNEDLQAIVLNCTRDHHPNYDRLHSMIYNLLDCVDHPFIDAYHTELTHFFVDLVRMQGKDEDLNDPYPNVINALNNLNKKIYAVGKKPSRVFSAFCSEIKAENFVSSYNQKMADITNEMSTKKEKYKLFIAIGADSFMTMSNPKCDDRGNMLTSCHSLNSTEYEYNNGCSGYARDNYTIIVFTCTNPDDPETIHNRKNSRQLFVYAPGNGLLLQSRMYNANGGTTGTQRESKVYREIVQKVICEIEGVPNAWHTQSYISNDEEESCRIPFYKDSNFGGYPDWEYAEFCAKVSVRKDRAADYELLTIGKSGLCLQCGEEINENIYCDDCMDNVREAQGYWICDDCDESFSDRCDRYTVHGPNGEERIVCDHCIDEYRYCDECGRHVTDDFWDDDYDMCNDCAYDHQEEEEEEEKDNESTVSA